MNKPPYYRENSDPFSGVFSHGNEALKSILNVDRDEVLRYLEYHEGSLDNEMQQLIDSCIDEVMEISQYKYVYRIFKKGGPGLETVLEDSTIELLGNDVQEHLRTSNHVAVMAATLGIEVEKRIMYYGKINLTRGIILDSCAAQLVEEFCDFIEEKIKSIANGNGLNITSRFSPGYGDLPISIQGQILGSLNASKLIGLNVSESSILLPRKSVTAFIGITREVVKKERTCISCSLNGSCEFYREGEDGCAR